MAYIRKMREHETESVLALWNMNAVEAAGHELAEANWIHIRYALERYATHPDVCCLIAEDRSEAVGFVTANVSSHPAMDGLCGEIEELYVKPQVRRKGIGTALVEQAMSFLRAQGATVFRAHVCIESQSAIAFWRHAGWENDLATFSCYENV